MPKLSPFFSTSESMGMVTEMAKLTLQILRQSSLILVRQAPLKQGQLSGTLITMETGN